MNNAYYLLKFDDHWGLNNNYYNNINDYETMKMAYLLLLKVLYKRLLLIRSIGIVTAYQLSMHYDDRTKFFHIHANIQWNVKNYQISKWSKVLFSGPIVYKGVHRSRKRPLNIAATIKYVKYCSKGSIQEYSWRIAEFWRVLSKD